LSPDLNVGTVLVPGCRREWIEKEGEREIVRRKERDGYEEAEEEK